eukprot:TRINITY_DN1392_c0_g1_i1.p1 TRINITY_DN1392_c0_g1~~TRINITY_DN1392_c0_g1_i1.p1  ORF type:complete len:136 (-),score=31.13 TRINITY_DN1392_c0_g1_i1:32-439(-)
MADISGAVAKITNVSAAHGEWAILGVNSSGLYLQATGNGVQSLKDGLKDTDVNFALLTLRLTLEQVPNQARNIFIHWKGPSASGKVKVGGNQYIQKAIDTLSPNHGQLEVVGKTHFNEETIATKWKPSEGSHIID